jgi:hypothetical protein
VKRRGVAKYNYKTPHGKRIVDRVFTHFQAWTRGDPVRIKAILGVPMKTTRGWYRHWLRDGAWRPYQPTATMRRRLFTSEQEAELARRIRDDYLAQGCIFTDADFRLLAIEAYYAWNPINADEEAPTFKQFRASNGFIRLFKKRNRFSSRRSHFKRRSPPNPALERQFLTEIQEIMSRTDPQFILNCDETSWKLYPNRLILSWTHGLSRHRRAHMLSRSMEQRCEDLRGRPIARKHHETG